MKKIFLRTFCLLLFSSPLFAAAVPTVGTPAPALTFTELLQAPQAAKADWTSLKGKAVLVNFWATYCPPCVAELPLLNALIKSVDPAKVQLIAVDYDGEDRAKVAAFLKQHPISGWVGLDATREMQRRFGVITIPITFIIGPDGKLAHITDHLETLTGEQLTELADGKDVTFDDTSKASAALLDDQKKAAAEAEKTKIASLMATNGKILARISVPGHPDAVIFAEAASAPSDGMPADLVRTATWEPGRFNLVDGHVQDLVAQAFDDRATRVAVAGASTGKRYNLHVDMPGATPEALRHAVERAFASGLGVKIERKTVSKDVLLLTATATTASHLDGSGPKSEHYCDFMSIPPDKALTCASGTLGELADAVEAALEVPVLNETGLPGTITANLPVTVQDRAPVAALLSKELGLTLTPAKRAIEVLVVSAIK